MSSQKGNIARNRPQKHQNRSVFKNNLHDTSTRTKFINSLQIVNVCSRCKEIIEWKIKYKKYKTLSQPKTCVKCNKKNVKCNYHVMCNDCSKKYNACCKCLQSSETIVSAPDKAEEAQLDAEMKNALKTLPERKRRTFLRYLNKTKEAGGSGEQPTTAQHDDLMKKLQQLQVDEDDGFGSDFDCSDGSEDG